MRRSPMVPRWHADLIAKATVEFQSLPAPSERREEWRYTDISRLSLDTLAKSSIGTFQWKGSKNLVALELTKALEKNEERLKNYFLSLTPLDKVDWMQLALCRKGIVVIVPKGEVATLEIEQTPCLVHHVIVVEEGATLNLTETLGGEGFHGSLLSVVGKDNSTIHYSYLQNTDQKTIDLSTKCFTLSRQSKLRMVFATLGGKLSRTDVRVSVEGEGAQTEIGTLFFGHGRQHIDHSIQVRHSALHTENRIKSRGIMRDSSSSVVRGLIHIEKGAKKTDSSLESRSLLLSQNAYAHSIPSLVIAENDVICKHASSTGKIDEEQLFYLLSRGLDQKQAEQLIVEGYVEPIVQMLAPALAEKTRSVIEKLWS